MISLIKRRNSKKKVYERKLNGGSGDELFRELMRSIVVRGTFTKIGIDTVFGEVRQIERVLN